MGSLERSWSSRTTSVRPKENHQGGSDLKRRLGESTDTQFLPTNSENSQGESMNPSTFDWKSGTVDFWDLNEIDEAKPLGDQIDHLKEDLAQIRFPGGIVLDLG